MKKPKNINGHIMLPESIRARLSDYHGISVTETRSVSGGSINRALKVTANGDTFFLKWNASAPDDFFEKEARGLNLLREADSDLYFPEVIAVEDNRNDGNPGFLLMEWVENGAASSNISETFGRNVAELHQNKSEQYGLGYPNYIGSLPQSNKKHSGWISFFVEERISPQLKIAMDSGKLSRNYLANWERLSGRLNEIFPPSDPSLLHGDLWSGNYLFNPSGKAVLVDPAVYYGHPEMDLAFSKMFGGFSPDFYRGYETITPLEPGFSERVEICNFYPLLVHVNLFGGSYSRQAEQFLKQF